MKRILEMPIPIDITGERYGRLVALKLRGTDKNGVRLWLWRCDCGREIDRVASPIRSGRVVSCGCHKDEQSRSRAKHGMWKTRTYRAWIAMRARVRGVDQISIECYRDRGITVDPRWECSFEAFLADMGECPAGKTLGRIDNDGHYEPANCRWETQAEQCRNTRRTVRVTVAGIEMCLKDACSALAVNYDCVRSRIRLGASAEDALARG